MASHSISLKDAYIIETLRSNKVSNQEIIEKVESNNTVTWQEVNIYIDGERLVQLAKEVSLRSVIEDGYKVKFVTLKGLMNLLKLKFDKVEEMDYELTTYGIAKLCVDDNELIAIQNMLSRNWIVESEEGTVAQTFIISITAIPVNTS